MGNKFDYNEEEVMKILSDATKTDEQKKAAFDSYKETLLSERKTEIINRLNACAKDNPTITQEVYISMLKKYSNDNLEIPFDSIINDIDAFDKEMKAKYEEMERAKAVEVPTPAPIPETPAPVVPETPVASVEPEITITETPAVEEAPVNIEINAADEEITPDVTPFSNTVEANPLFDDNQMEISPDEADSQKGNANAIIISIITIIIGIVIMYSIIRLK
ncbi:MAG: hypothetical protein IKE10_01300 [Bacilli bacterium]|nr:hypothetical protein [Bacilli bacterium]